MAAIQAGSERTNNIKRTTEVDVEQPWPPKQADEETQEQSEQPDSRGSDLRREAQGTVRPDIAEPEVINGLGGAADTSELGGGQANTNTGQTDPASAQDSQQNRMQQQPDGQDLEGTSEQGSKHFSQQQQQPIQQQQQQQGTDQGTASQSGIPQVPPNPSPSRNREPGVSPSRIPRAKVRHRLPTCFVHHVSSTAAASQHFLMHLRLYGYNNSQPTLAGVC